MKDAQDSLRRHREARIAKEKASGKSIHPQPVIQSAGAPKKMGVIQKVKLASQALKTYKTVTSKDMKLSGSWKSTVFGAGGLGAALFNIASMLFDDNPNTNPDWGVYLPIIFASAVGLFTRDNDKSSQDVGLRPDGK